jgi:dTDP-4-amino-4,6-dideoxygalactose transaminase
VKVLASGKIIDAEELDAAMRALVDWASGSASGHISAEFGRLMASYIGVKYGIPTNSGSSANLLACMAVLNPGDEVITTALNFPTTLAPIIQAGAKPVLVDVSLDGFVPTFESVRKAISKQTKAIVLAHTLGYPFPANRLRKLCDDRGIWLIEDNCDALGTKIGSHNTGSFGHLSTLSFYPAHHITTWEGGMVLTDDLALSRKVRSLRDWGRACWCEPGQENACGHRFDGDYDHKYTYQYLGYNLKMPDFCAAIGIKQMLKLDRFIGTRRANHMHLTTRARELGLDKWFVLPEARINDVISWFGFSLVCKDGIDRTKLQRWLAGRDIGTRPVFGGNMLRQPACTGISYRLAEELTNTDIVHERGLWIGCWPGLGEIELNYALDKIYEFCRSEA